MANKFVNEFSRCQRMTYCNNSMICIACEIKICSHVDYQKAFLRLTASRKCSVFWLCSGK